MPAPSTRLQGGWRDPKDSLSRAAFALRMRSCVICNIATASPAPNSIPWALVSSLPPRSLDPRVARSIAQIDTFSGGPVTAASCAAAAGLSASRFLHLFKQETGISFRAFRAWKRARHLLHFANQDLNLAHLAQDIGYPDSTHFSHSIRRFYGLKPRAIFSGSRDLAIYHSGTAGAGQ